MAGLAIIKLPHRLLRKTAVEVRAEEIFSPKIQSLIAEMRKTLVSAKDGVGLAAPQVGLPLRIFLVSSEAAHLNADSRISTNDTNENKNKEWEYFVFINPVLKRHSRNKIEMAEGCLSLPGKFGVLPRAEKVSLEWLDGEGKKHGRGFTKFFARVIQHEMDHLNGILISDRAKRLVAVAGSDQHH